MLFLRHRRGYKCCGFRTPTVSLQNYIYLEDIAIESPTPMYYLEDIAFESPALICLLSLSSMICRRRHSRQMDGYSRLSMRPRLSRTVGMCRKSAHRDHLFCSLSGVLNACASCCRTAIGVTCKDGIVLGVEKIIMSALYEPKANPRNFTVDRHVGVVSNDAQMRCTLTSSRVTWSLNPAGVLWALGRCETDRQPGKSRG